MTDQATTLSPGETLLVAMRRASKRQIDVAANQKVSGATVHKWLNGALPIAKKRWPSLERFLKFRFNNEWKQGAQDG